MRTFTKSLSGLLSASALAIGLSVIAQPAFAATGVANSVHNLSTAGLGGASTQICVYCHTPHGSNDQVAAPLWNKGLSGDGTAPTTYTIYTSSTLDGSTDQANLTVSLACLSCHDGVQARDNMINRPGSGLWSPNNPDGTGGVNMGGDPPVLDVIGGPLDIINLSTDLSNDHPIGMNYCAALSAADAVAGTCGDDSFFSGAGVIATSGTRYWVETAVGTPGSYEKTDLPLYSGGAAASSIAVECATCHDPHNAIENNTFLRIDADASALCLTCHNK